MGEEGITAELEKISSCLVCVITYFPGEVLRLRSACREAAPNRPKHIDPLRVLNI